MVKNETITRTVCVIEDDVWLGHNSIILPSVKSIGRGAVVGAGAVVTKNVPKYAVVVGNPAVVIKYRFSPEVIDALEKSKWWEIDMDEFRDILNSDREYFFNPTS
jgi:acetyltransferase-like isoleucine patch superfamily enzyme